MFGATTPGAVSAHAVGWRTRAEQARRDLAEIQALPVTEAAQLVRERAARAEAEHAAAERAQAIRDARAAHLDPWRSTQQRSGPERGLGF